MWHDDWEQESIELTGWPVQLISGPVSDRYVATVKSTSSLDTIATAIATTREQAEHKAVQSATNRLLRTIRFDPELTVGG